jgi:prolyl-tRNA editing enzyme YbaK/EbsC (Cys-tRNA(Pro) deacylase)
MKYRDLQIQTQREAPNNARTEGFSFLVRAGYLTRENVPTQLGETALEYLRYLANAVSFISYLSLPTIGNDNETFFPITSGNVEIAHCPSCKYTERLELARFAKTPFSQEEQLPIEKVLTPDCNTIESLANFLNIPKEQTAKALMYTRISDGKFIFFVVRGDMQVSEAKLKAQVGDIRPATVEEIVSAGAAAGYASAIGLKEALIVVDDLIPTSNNLVAGANESGYHLLNTNYGRDYSAEIVADLIQAKAGDACIECGNPLSILSGIILANHTDYNFENILLALAETHHALRAAFPRTKVLGTRTAMIMMDRLHAAAEIAPALAPHIPGLLRCFDHLGAETLDTQRVHGDFHLGQTLHTPAGWKIIDFEGEPAKTMAERRALDAIWRDIAGMLRSFDYAAASVPGPHSMVWAAECRTAFLRGYAGAGLSAADRSMLRAYEADKAIYEVVYETRNRPDWVGIPLRAVAALAADNRGSGGSDPPTSVDSNQVPTGEPASPPKKYGEFVSPTREQE